MTRDVLLKELWSVANVITGFAVLQTITFTYACLKPEFSGPEITTGVKTIITLFLVLATLAECYAISWCTKKCIALIDADNETDKLLMMQTFKQAAWGRIIVVSVLILPSLLSLFAEEMRVMFSFF